MKISDISIKKPISVLVLIITAWLVGVISLVHLPVNLLPDITYPMVKVYINWRGATPEEIEDNIAEVVEQKMATVDNLDYLDSQCTEGLYTLLVNFTYDANRDVAYQDVLAKMGLVRKNLPKDAEEPLIFKADPSQLPVMDLIITSDEWDIVKLRTWVENYLQEQFSSVEGSAGSEVSGGAKREIRIYLNPYKIQVLGISLDKVAQRLKEENIELAGGRVTTERKEFIVRTLADFKNIDEIKNVIIISDKYGRSIYLKDIAEVKDTSDIQRIITKLNKREGVKLSIFKQAAANTIDVEKNIKQKLKELKSILPTGIKIGIIYNQADYIRAANKGVRDAAVLAGILVVLITIVFLTGWRRVLIIVLTLPTTLLASFFVMKLLNFSINIFSLGGLVVSFTVILDNSIVVLQNITRLQEEKREEAISFGVNQVGKPILFSTLTFMAIFLPFLMVPGLTSLLFRELVITTAVVIGFSLLSAIAVVPALATLLFKSKKDKLSQPSLNRFQIIVDKIMSGISEKYEKLLDNILERRKTVVIILAIVFLGLSIFIFRFIGTEFLPQADDGMITVKVKMPTGTAVSETGKVLSQIENVIKNLPDVEKFSTLVGGKVWGLVTYEIPHEGEVDIQLVSKSKRKLITDDWVKKYAEEIQKNVKYPGAKVKVFHTKMKGIKQVGEFDVEIELHSPRTTPLVEMFNTATKIMAAIKDVKGMANLDLSVEITKPEYQVLIDRNKIADLGLTANQVANTIKTLVDGQIVTYYKEEGYYYPIRLVVNEENFRGKQDVANIPLFCKNGLIYLRDIAGINHGVGPLEIDRQNQMRIINVTASVIEGNVGDVTHQAYNKVKNIQLPSGSFLKLGAQAQMMRENFKNMLFIVLLGLFFAYVILTIQFESLLLPTIILFTIPFPIAGFLFALFIAGIPIGVTALIGIIVLIGMLINHWVLVLSFIEEKLADGTKLKEAVIYGTGLRLEPIFMTFLTDVLGLFPFLLGVQEGTEMLRPLGVAVVGGITYSLFITFFFLPVFYYLVKSYFAKEMEESEN